MRASHGTLAQQPRGERVDRRDDAAVEVGEGGVEVPERLLAKLGVLVETGLSKSLSIMCDEELEALADLLTQLPRRLLGERDRGDLSDGHAAQQRRDVPSDEQAGLAGARTCLDEVGRPQVACGLTADLVVDGLTASGDPHAPASLNASKAARRGSARLRSAAAASMPQP